MFYFNKNTKKSKSAQFYPDREVGIPIGIPYFRSELWISDRNYGFLIKNPLFRSTIFLIFNYKKVPIKTKILQLGPFKPNQTFKTYS